ncbi:ATPase [Streptomyces radiopugnans]
MDGVFLPGFVVDGTDSYRLATTRARAEQQAIG